MAFVFSSVDNCLLVPSDHCMLTFAFCDNERCHGQPLLSDGVLNWDNEYTQM